MEFTLSVRSFRHGNIFYDASPPSSLPFTSRATRYFEANELSWSPCVDGVLQFRISPRASTVILRERSPFATAVVTAAYYALGW